MYGISTKIEIKIEKPIHIFIKKHLKMDKMDKTTYVAPSIKVVPFRVEIGFAGSFTKTEVSDQLIMFETEDNRNEQYTFSDLWN